MKNIFTLITIFTLSTTCALAQCGVHRTNPQAEVKQRSSVIITPETTDIKKLATISKREARKVATSQYPGKVKEAELINEDGTLVWKLEIKGNEGQKEIFVDPANGTFLGYGLTR